MKTVNVKNAFSGRKGTYPAYCDQFGKVVVLDSVAGHYTSCHNLTVNQVKYVERNANCAHDIIKEQHDNNLRRSAEQKYGGCISGDTWEMMKNNGEVNGCRCKICQK